SGVAGARRVGAPGERRGLAGGLGYPAGAGGAVRQPRGGVVIGPRSRGYAIVLGTFVLGGLCGGGVGYALSQRSLSALVSEERSEARDARRLEAFTRELDLSNDQRERVRRIVERRRPERDRLMRRMFEECGQAMQRDKESM